MSPGDATARPSLPRRSERLTRELSTLILEGRLPEGERLPTERELMRRYGVSRPVVREAVFALANQGLIRLRPRYRPVVSRPDLPSALRPFGHLVSGLAGQEAGARVLFDTRVFFEAALARWAALHARREELDALRRHLLANRAAIGIRREFERTDTEFHDVLYRIPGNPVFPAAHRAYVDWLSVHWARIDGSAEVDQAMYAGHERLFEAVAGRDPDGAEDALRRHLHAAWEMVRATFLFPPGTPAAASCEGRPPNARG